MDNGKSGGFSQVSGKVMERCFRWWDQVGVSWHVTYCKKTRNLMNLPS